MEKIIMSENTKQIDNADGPAGTKIKIPPKHKGRPKSSKTKKVGRKRNKNFLSWEEAKEFIHNEMIPSRGKFAEWWDLHKPKTIPKYPYRVYTQEWTTWNDFLGTNNVFGQRQNTGWRPLEDAIKWVHTLQLKSYAEWMKYCKGAEIPSDIPKRPELVYTNWRSWNHWLGNTMSEAISAKQEASTKITNRTQVYYIIHNPDVPQNVISVGVETDGLPALKERWEYRPFDIIKLFWFDPSKQEQITHLMNNLSFSYLGDEYERVAPNVWEIIYHLELLMDVVTKQEMLSSASTPKNPLDFR